MSLSNGRKRLRANLERLQRKHSTVLLCPECGERFTLRTEHPVLEVLAAAWSEGHEGESYREVPADVLTVARHEHSPEAMVNEATGRVWIGPSQTSPTLARGRSVTFEAKRRVVESDPRGGPELWARFEEIRRGALER